MDSVYRNPTETVEDRIKNLLSLMTLKEKIGQMTQIERSVTTPSAIKDFTIGSVYCAPPNSATAKKEVSSDWADMVDGFQKLALESRLGIPIIYCTDAIHGNNNVYGTTIFPHNVGLGATRDADLVQKIAAATSLELRASGTHYTLAPSVSVCKDPRWGRCYESYSEDTEIVQNMTSYVSGLQGQPPEHYRKGYPFLAGRNKAIACARHFVGDGGTEKGVNEGNTILSYEDLEKIHMAPYVDCIAQGVSTIMVSYSSWNGVKLHGHHFLINDILKEKLGFKGFVISDWEGIDELCQPYGSDYRYCISTSINAGIDMVMVPLRYEQFMEELTSLVQSGEVPMTRIDDAVERILRVKFIAELFEFPLTDRSLLDTVGCKIHRDLAREAVRKSLVLLKNGKEPSKPFIPLNKNAKRILVAGTHANDIGYQCGGWTFTKYGSSGQITIGTTILDAVKEAVGHDTEVIYEKCPSTEFIECNEFSFAIVAIGEAPYAECGGDNKELVIPFNGAGIVDIIADKIPTLVILISGRPLVLEQGLLEKTEALVAAWLPGSEGKGITDVIFGDHDFKGKLPMTWFRRIEQLDEPSEGVNSCDDPLFPLGYGLACNK
ncbi:putative glucan 1,3-beta-glucosidase [Medicago truncatula]|uniref:Glycoside hydrolase family 3 protein n=1 Tax=Medicago truncatula TaxID=3880 RepID=G7K6A7_MEDTR|nr:beta-glucosidase BoGH3B [Medicago truncatula]AES98545.1 glycoside hydrolase family 3 protein [Medicago truncatula]RHN56445.1 putative glucan 1,3-beta-glucosidase [Medicago truncatula]